VVDTAAPQQVELGVRNQALSRQETVKQFGNRCVLGVLLVALVDEKCQCNAYSIRFDTRIRRQLPRLGSFDTQLLQWAAPTPLTRVTQAGRRELRLAVSSD
jgi:hypothetical protein